MWEVINSFLSFVIGVIISALTLAWRHRRKLAPVIEYLVEMMKDGKIERREVAYLLKLLGKTLEEVE